MSLLPSESPLQQSSTVRLVFWYGRPLFSLPDRSLCDLYIDDPYYRPADVESCGLICTATPAALTELMD